MPLPRLQFRLRTLLIGVALLSVPCAYVAHEYRIVAARRAWLEDNVEAVLLDDQLNIIVAKRNPAADPCLLRRWLGDRPVESLSYPTRVDAEAAKKFFPEAEIIIP